MGGNLRLENEMKYFLENLFIILTFTVVASQEEYFTGLCILTGSIGITLHSSNPSPISPTRLMPDR